MRELRDIDGLHPRDLSGRQRLLVAFGVGLVALVLSYTLVYQWGMRTLEDRPRTIFQALNTVIETMTTTGYGADSPWETPAMNLFVAAMQVSGVVVGFVTLRVLVIPLFERTPLNLDDRLSTKDDHVVVAEYDRDTKVLLDELEVLGVDYVLVESDEAEAKALSDDGYQAIHGDPETARDLSRASVADAKLLITDAGDRTASVVLTALEANEDLVVVSFTESTRRKTALAEVGVDRSVAPGALIGTRLAEKATTPISVDAVGGDRGEREPGVDGVPDDAGAVGIREILVRHDSDLEGVRVGDSPLARHPDVTLVAAWLDGDLRMPVSADDRLTPNAVLVVAGPERTLDELSNEVAGDWREHDAGHSHVVVAGYGEGGSAAVDALPADVGVTTVDERDGVGADVVGDVTEPETLTAAGIGGASALVVTVDDDAAALLTVAMARSLAPDLEILARVTDTEKASAAFRAGADYVLSTQRVSARLVAAEVHGERVMDPVGQIRLVRADADPLAGRTLADARSNASNPWTVVGLVRDGAVVTAETASIEADDEVFVAGSDGAIQAFDRAVDGD